MVLGERLKESRMNRGYSQGDVADHLQISRQSISKWENGNSYPDLDNLVKLSDYYEISTDELLKENEVLKNELKIEEYYQKLTFIQSKGEKDEGLILLAVALISFLITPIGLIVASFLIARNKQTNSLYKIVYLASICGIAYNLFMGYGILSDIFSWGTTTVEYLG
ncbi:Helix-turn-helix domain-containing protein [Carnobacterium iners]|uniref:Helix-turn-helix domain-containing protein n=1 Tax=Carnobacterium iners TaxID=1073423 RepID=A0A1X7MQC7_9LACT|nr:helix-turn-helix domain-containing protein [Carnobacterium iners]SEL24186.1 Helix-turn-helix domain-containing protein [Carnobacterium iners]SMH27012.1 Helix-turn-helix domain-containing protein [Carnobacterium iners]